MIVNDSKYSRYQFKTRIKCLQSKVAIPKTVAQQNTDLIQNIKEYLLTFPGTNGLFRSQQLPNTQHENYANKELNLPDTQ